MKRVLSIALVSFFVGVVNAQASSIVIPETGGQIHSFGETNSATYGQTFKTVNAVDLVLDSFSLWVVDFSFEPDAIDFAGYVMQWDTALNRATGPVLYESTQRTTVASATSQRFDFLTGGLTLNSANTYVAFLSASNFFDGLFGFGGMPRNDPGAYADGHFVYMDNGSDFGALTTNTWDSFGPVQDLQFEAQFSSATPVPEPASMLLLGSGLIGAGVRRYRQRRSRG